MTETTNTTKHNDLTYLLESLNAQSDWHTLDIIRDADHFTLSGEAADVYPNLEHLPFEDNALDLVTCRSAAHHLADIYRFASEARRVLKPNGILAVYDALVSEHKRAADYLNAFERLRDPSHIRAYSETDWRSTFLDADFSIERVETGSHDVNLREWAQGCSPYILERLHILLAQAPKPVADWLQSTCIGTKDTTFTRHHILIIGKKNND
jgi:SAM-dependent methyltransferase